MSAIKWIYIQLLPILGFVCALILLVHILRKRESPASTMAWLLAILFIPYVGVPLYIMFGGRKVKRLTRNRRTVPRETSVEVDGAPPKKVAVFPYRTGNAVSLLPTGRSAYEAILQAIHGAKESIYITTYIFGKDQTGEAILEALVRRLRDGVEVRLVLDALGSRKVSESMLADFHEAGGRSAFFMPMLHLPFRGRANLRNHRKIVLADRKVAVIGGMNLAREYMGAGDDHTRWTDLALTLRGPVVADLEDVFLSDWAFASDEELEPIPPNPPYEDDGEGVPLQVVPSGPDVSTDYLYDTVLTNIFSAERRIWIASPYLIPDEMLTKGLCIAAGRGVDVRIVVPRRSDHRLADLVRRGYLRQIQDAGGRVMLFTPGMMHAKLILIDDAPAIIGSMNVDMRSFFLNFEIAVFVYSGRAVTELERWARDLMVHCREGVAPTSTPVEFMEGIGRLLAPLL